MVENGLVTLPSFHSVKETIDRLETVAKSRGLTIFARIDHAAGATAAGMALRPTELIVFGNAQGGTPLMQASQTIGIDLPLKALAWEDQAGKVWLAYNDPAWLVLRHGIEKETAAATVALTAALAAIVQHAAN